MSRLYEGESPGHTSTSSPRLLPSNVGGLPIMVREIQAIWEGGWLSSRAFLRTYLAIEGSHMTFFVDARSGFYLAAIFKVCGQMVRGLERGLLAGLEQSKFSNYPITCGKIQMATMKTHPTRPLIDLRSKVFGFKNLLCISKACHAVNTTGLFIMIRCFLFLLTKLPNLLNR